MLRSLYETGAATGATRVDKNKCMADGILYLRKPPRNMAGLPFMFYYDLRRIYKPWGFALLEDLFFSSGRRFDIELLA